MTGEGTYYDELSEGDEEPGDTRPSTNGKGHHVLIFSKDFANNWTCDICIPILDRMM